VLEDRLAPAVITVNSTADTASPPAGTVTLRSAILAANASPGSTIDFAIPGSGVQVIQPASALPTITAPVLIDGYSQPGASVNTLATGDNAVLQIVLDGSLVSGGGSALTIFSDNTTIRGLDIQKFPSVGILLAGSHNLIAGDFVGTDVSGTVAEGNGAGGVSIDSQSTVGGAVPADRNVISGNLGGAGVIFGRASTNDLLSGNYIGITASGNAALPNLAGVILFNAFANTIGGTAAGAGNVISGNQADGVVDNGGPGNQVLGNRIGTDPAGTTALPNGHTGVTIENTNTPGPDNAGGNLIYRNVISGNKGDGILLFGPHANAVIHNFIGTNATGSAALANLGNGVEIILGHSNTIGGGNVISGNGVAGVRLFNGAGGSTSGNIVQGNFIGTDASGKAAIGNRSVGVAIGGGASQNTVGGTVAGAGNVISGNGGMGVLLNAGPGRGMTNENLVDGNRIGTDLTGVAPLPNHSHGVGIINGSFGNTIGGTMAGAGNTIAFNRGTGVVVVGNGGGNAILGDAIFGNTQLGIDLGADGVTPNDPINPDTGPNNRQNYPVLTTAITTNSGTTITGTLQSAKSAMFRVEFFSAPVMNPSGHGQGKNFLGFTTVTTDASGNGSFTFNTAAPVSVGLFASATATDAFGDTSEFSQDVKVTSGTRTTLGAAAASADMLGLVRAIGLTGSVEQNAPAASPPLARPPTSTLAALLSPLWDERAPGSDWAGRLPGAFVEAGAGERAVALRESTDLIDWGDVWNDLQPAVRSKPAGDQMAVPMARF
jgi:titin